MSANARWTFMVYLAGDNNLSAAGDADLAEMRRVGSTPEVNVVAQFDNAGPLGTRRFRVTKDGLNEPVETLPETDSGSPDSLLDFVTWAHQHYPAEHYALVLWNHGGGWEPTEMDRVARGAGALAYSGRESVQRAASPLRRTLFRTSLGRIFGLASPDARAICSDDGSGHSLDTVELGAVLAQICQLIGRPLDILGMDACLMSNLEVAYQARSYANFLVASEETEPNAGWPYDTVLAGLTANPLLSAPDLAVSIVQAYNQSYADQNYPGAVTQTALDLSKIDQLTAPLDQLAGLLSARMPRLSNAVWMAQRNSAYFFHNTLWDIGDFAGQLGRQVSLKTIKKSAAAVQQALRPGPGQLVLASLRRGAKVQNCAGVSIYLLPPPTDISQFYADLAYSKEHRWASFLTAYHNP
jgi:hypothetical protein